jgi:hypothetical protein
MSISGLARAAASPCLREPAPRALHGDLQHRLHRDPGDQNLPGDARCHDRATAGLWLLLRRRQRGRSSIDLPAIAIRRRSAQSRSPIRSTCAIPISASTGAATRATCASICELHCAGRWRDALHVTGENVVTTSATKASARRLAADKLPAGRRVCTDSDPVTRIVDGVAVTQPCWAWSRSYTCAQDAGSGLPDAGSTPGCRWCARTA